MKYDPPDKWKNMHNIISCLEKSGEENQSRASLAKALQLSRTTSSIIINQLISARLVNELTSAASGRGRPGIPLALSEDYWYALGAALVVNEWCFVIVTLQGRIVREHVERVRGASLDRYISALTRGLDRIIPQCPGKLLPLIGIGAPGLVNNDKGIIISAVDMGWQNVDLGDMVLKHTGIPAMVFNRHRTSGLAEARFGAGRNVSNLVYIGIGSGISAAIISNGALTIGASYCSGEIGHIMIDPNGPLCGCGKRGCLHTFASSGALINSIKEKYQALLNRKGDPGDNPLWTMLKEHKSINETIIVQEAERGNKVAIDALKSISHYLGIAVTNLINILNPEKIIIGGPLSNSTRYITRFISEEAAAVAFHAPLSVARIEQSALGNKAGALGAACLPLTFKLELVFNGALQKHTSTVEI